MAYCTNHNRPGMKRISVQQRTARVRKLFCVALALLLAAAAPAPGARAAERHAIASIPSRPVWMIAHRVLTVGGVDHALKHGANALEIDATAWREGWWADHDGTLTSYGDTMADMFERIVHKRRAGSNVGFVWLDIKNPNYCSSSNPVWRHCSVAALRHLARRTLEPVGVRVLYGFYGTEGGTGWKDVSTKLNHQEAVSVSGDYAAVRTAFITHGPAIATNQRVMDKGLFNLNVPTVLSKVRGQLRLGSEARDRSELARVFGWTVGHDDQKAIQQLLDVHGGNADGLIYGHRASCYPDGVPGLRRGCGKDESVVMNAISAIHDFIQANSATHRVATLNDIPFGD